MDIEEFDFSKLEYCNNMSASNSDEIFDLNKIPIEVLDKGYVSYRKYCSGTEGNMNDKQIEV
jgi:hypothetical protein